MSNNIPQGKPDFWIKAMFVLAAAGLCLSLAVSIALQRMVSRGWRAELEMPAHVAKIAVITPNSSLTARQISEIIGQTDVLNKILMNGLAFNSPKSNRNGIGYFQQPGGAL